MPELYSPCRDQQPQRGCLKQRKRLGKDEHGAFGKTIRDDASKEPKKQYREKLERANDTQQPGIVREIENQPVLTGHLHPSADQRNKLTGPEKTKVAMPQGADRPWQMSCWLGGCFLCNHWFFLLLLI